MTVTQASLVVVITGRAIEVDIENGVIGSASIPASVLQQINASCRPTKRIRYEFE